jgi:hypothetical protein
MAEIVEFALRDGAVVRFEADAGMDGRPVMRGAGRPAETLTVARETLEEALSGVAPACAALVDALRGIGDDLESVEAEFGLKVSADAGFVVARAGGEANFRVLVRWRRP